MSYRDTLKYALLDGTHDRRQFRGLTAFKAAIGELVGNKRLPYEGGFENVSLTAQINEEVTSLQTYAKSRALEGYDTDEQWELLAKRLAMAAASIKAASSEAHAAKGSRYYAIKRLADRLPPNYRRMFVKEKDSLDSALWKAKQTRSCFQFFTSPVKFVRRILSCLASLCGTLAKCCTGREDDPKVTAGGHSHKAWAANKTKLLDKSVKQRFLALECIASGTLALCCCSYNATSTGHRRRHPETRAPQRKQPAAP